jgi:phage portal protein BeeE
VSFLDRALARRREDAKDEARFGLNPFGGGVFNFGGTPYNFGINQTMIGSGVERVENSFVGYVNGAYKQGGVVSACVAARMHVLSQVRFQWQNEIDGRFQDFYSNPELEIVKRPWRGGTTQGLIARMEQHNSLAGNAFVLRRPNRLVVLRPDWVTIVRTSEDETDNPIDAEFAGVIYAYPGRDPEFYPASEVAHWAPLPDPLAEYRGMSWLTPVLRQITGHQAAAEHKWNFFKSGATPNMVIKFDPKMAAEQVQAFAAIFEDEYVGEHNAYKTMFLGGGADVSVVGADFQQMDFKQVQGADETLIAAAAGVPPVIVGFSEGLSGSSLNQGNYQSAKRQFADTTIAYLAGDMSASLEALLRTPAPNARLWWDMRDVPFFRQDAKDEAEIHSMEAATMRTLVDGGFDPASVIAAIANQDMSLVQHTGNLSVQLQPPGTESDPAPDTDGDSEDV